MFFLRRIWYLVKVSFAYLRAPKYSIKRGYIHRRSVISFDDTDNEDEFQKEVYQKSFDLYLEKNLTGILDIGCGSGFKLIKYFEGKPKAGVEIKTDFLNKKYPDGKWFEFADKAWREYDAELLICSDVIEHVPNPAIFLEELASLKRVKYFVFSTPDRNLDNSQWTYGPPNNESHYREWSFEEFGKFISQYFKVISHEITNENQRTQMIIACLDF